MTELRDFVVTVLRHHHESEDRDLRPMLETAAPTLAPALAGLTDEHDRLDTVASTPQRWTNVLVALLDHVGSPAAVALTLRNVPPEARRALPEARRLGAAALDRLGPVWAGVA